MVKRKTAKGRRTAKARRRTTRRATRRHRRQRAGAEFVVVKTYSPKTEEQLKDLANELNGDIEFVDHFKAKYADGAIKIVHLPSLRPEDKSEETAVVATFDKEGVLKIDEERQEDVGEEIKAVAESYMY